MRQKALLLSDCLAYSSSQSKKRDCFTSWLCYYSSYESLSLTLKASSQSLSEQSLSYSSNFTLSSSSEDSSKPQNSFSSSKNTSSSFFTSSYSSLVSNQDLAYSLTSSSLAPLATFFLFNLSLKRSYQPLLKLNSFLPGILRSSMICLACLRMCFLFILGLLRMKLASLIYIQGYRALLPPSFFLSSFVWYQRVMFLGCIPVAFALSLMILDKHSLDLCISYLIYVINFFLNSIVQLLQVIAPTLCFSRYSFFTSPIFSFLFSFQASFSNLVSTLSNFLSFLMRREVVWGRGMRWRSKTAASSSSFSRMLGVSILVVSLNYPPVLPT